MYELTVVASSKVDSDLAISKVEKILKDVRATDIGVTSLGKKVLAYPIAKQTEAEYLLFNFQAPGDAVKNITDSLRLDQEGVLRYLLIKAKEVKHSVKVKTAKAAKLEEPTAVAAEPKKTKKTIKLAAKSAKVEKKGTKSTKGRKARKH